MPHAHHFTLRPVEATHYPAEGRNRPDIDPGIDPGSRAGSSGERDDWGRRSLRHQHDRYGPSLPARTWQVKRLGPRKAAACARTPRGVPLIRLAGATLGIAFPDALTLLAYPGLDRSLAHEPLGRGGEQGLDFGGRQRLRDSPAQQAGCRYAQLAGDDRSGVRAIEPQLDQPGGRGGEQGVQLLTGDGGSPELFGRCWKVDPQLLSGGRRFHGLRRRVLSHPDSVA